jgi:hypothetical protein
MWRVMILSSLALMLGGPEHMVSSRCSGADLDRDIRKCRMGTLVIQVPEVDLIGDLGLG